MEPQFHINDDLNELQRTLHQLAPTPARLDMAQTMFRAGQATACRASAWQRVWPATSAALALVSMTLGVLLMVPDQPRVVYVPVESAVPQSAAPERAVAAADSNSAADHKTEPQAVVPYAQWLITIRSLHARNLAAADAWETTSGRTDAAQQASIPALCSGDWRTMVDGAGMTQDSAAFGVLPTLDWKHLLHIRGS